MADTHHKELMAEMQRLRLEERSKDEILDFVDKLLLFSEKLVNKTHKMEYKLQELEQRQDLLMADNKMLLDRIEKVISRASENPREAMEIILQLIHDSANKYPGIIN